VLFLSQTEGREEEGGTLTCAKYRNAGGEKDARGRLMMSRRETMGDPVGGAKKWEDQ